MAHVAGEDQQVGPGDLPAVLLLDRPEQPARLVEVRVVGPAVERGEALRAAAAAAAAVGDAVRAGGVPRHPDEERPVVAVVGRPPVLRRRHHLDEVPLQRVDVEGLELLGVVEVLAQRVGLRASAGGGPAGRADSATSPGSSAAGAPSASGTGLPGFRFQTRRSSCLGSRFARHALGAHGPSRRPRLRRSGSRDRRTASRQAPRRPRSRRRATTPHCRQTRWWWLSPDAQLVQRGRARGLDAPHDAGVAARAEHVVDRLASRRAELGAHRVDDDFGGRVRMFCEHLEHGDARRRNPKAGCPQQLGRRLRMGHEPMPSPFLESVKKETCCRWHSSM